MTEAFDVLSDPKKRAVYDRFGQYSDNLADAAAKGAGATYTRGTPFDFSGFDWGAATTAGGGTGSSFRDIFSDLFGGGKAEREPPRPQPQRGADIVMPLSLTFEEAITGLTTNLTVNRSEQCSRCHGAGDTGGPLMVCSTCKGTLTKTETVKVRIPAGVDTGSRVRIPGKGEGGRLGAPPGDLFIITNVGRHQYFTRKGDNIYVTVPITVPEESLGAKIEVPTVAGKAQLRIPPGTQSGQKFRLRRRGAPSLRDANVHGDQFVEVQVTLPKIISEETKELLRRYAQMNAENPRVAMGLE